MKQKQFKLLMALVMMVMCQSKGWAESVFTYTATSDINSKFISLYQSIGNVTCDEWKNENTPVTVTVDGTVESIGWSAFYSCSDLTSITIPNSVTSISDYAFEFCSGITSINIPSSVKSIGTEAFYKCSSLNEITIQDGLTSIGDEAFTFCYELSSLTIPSSVTNIGTNAFGNDIIISSNINNSSSLNLEDYGLLIADIEQTDGLFIKDNSVIYCRKNATNVTIPNTVTSIRENAFNGCSDLTSLTIPSSVKSIEDYACSGCYGIKSLTIPEGVERIGKSAFSSCKSLTSLIIPSSVKNIEKYAFNKCYSITSLTISEGVESIGYCAFMDCEGLSTITIPNTVTSIGEYAFQGCLVLNSLSIPSSVTSIEHYAFGSDIILSSNINNSSSFNLEDYGLKIADTEQADGLFLKDNNAIYCRKNATNVTIPDNVTSIESWLFHSCSNLTSITIPNSVTSIGWAAFASCKSLTSLTLPSSVESISNNVFYDCDNLKTLNFNSIPEMSDETMNKAPENCNYTLTLSDDSYIHEGTNEKLPNFTTAPTYTRTIDAECNYGIVVVPFQIKSGNDVQLYQIGSINNDEITLKAVEIVDANTPCIFKKKTANATSVIITANTNNVEVGDIKKNGTTDGFAIQGTYSKKENISDVYYITENKFLKTSTAITINPCNGWLENITTSGINELNIVVPDDGPTTTISHIENASSHTVYNSCFNIHGQRLTSPKKGQINIINGHKVIVK